MPQAMDEQLRARARQIYEKHGQLGHIHIANEISLAVEEGRSDIVTEWLMIWRRFETLLQKP